MLKRFLFILLFLLPVCNKTELIEVNALNYNEEFILSSGRNHSILLTKDNNVYIWGLLGEANNVLASKKFIKPTNISSYIELKENEEIINVFSGEQHCFILTSLSKVYALGSGEKGQLGYSDFLFKATPTDITLMFDLNENEKITHISCGDDFNVCLTNKNRVLTFGNNKDYQLGISEKDSSKIVYDITSDFILQDGDFIKDVVTGASHTLALSNNGYVYGWGSNRSYQLGIKDVQSISKPTLLEFFVDSAIKISCGRFNSYVLTNQSLLYGFGSDSYGQLATNKPILSSNVKEEPYLINSTLPLEIDEYIVDIYSGYNYAIVKSNLKNFYSFGENNSGQLANGSSISTSVPVKMEYQNLLKENDEITNISCGLNHVIATSKFNRVYGWGSNLYNQLTLDSNFNQTSVKITNITNNFPPIVIISTTSASILYNTYFIEVDAYYLDDEIIKETYYLVSDFNEIVDGNWIKFDKQIILDENYEGKKYVHIKVVSEKEEYYHISNAFILDHKAPILKLSDKNNKNFFGGYSNSTIFAEAIDDNNAVSIVYTYNDEQYYTNQCTYSFIDDGKYQVYAVDEANNISATIEFTIDTILPTIITIDNNLISSSSFSTKEKQITIFANEAISCYQLTYNNNKSDSYIALNENENSFTIKLKKGVNTLTIFDLAGNQSLTYEITYSPRFFQDTQLLLIIFSTLSIIFVITIILVYTIKNKRRLTE